jgi:transcription termination factor Rho
MSVDSTTLERSALERKDRDELTTIAQALGAKPPSRARKAEIVQMILELTGVSEPASSAAAPASPAAAPAAPAAEAAPAPAEASEAAPAAPSAGNGGDAPADVAAEAPSAPAQQPLADWDPTPSGGAPSAGAGEAGSGATTAGARNGAATDAPAEQRPREGRSDQPRGRDQGRGDRDRGDQGGRGQGKGDQSPSGQGGQAAGDQSRNQGNQAKDNNQGNQGQGNQGKDGGQGDDGESGNRRRRRRGRRGGNEQQQGPNQGPSDEFAGEPVEVSGLLDLRDEGYGFLRVKGFLPSKDDIYVSVKQARQVGLRKGDHIVGGSRPALRNEKNPALLRIDQVNGKHPDEARRRRRFEDLTPLFPDSPLHLETAAENMTARIIDLISPIGKGQRGLIVSPPKAGKTTIMKQVARSIERNNPEVKLIVLLVDERPEEVTDMRRWLQSDASEVVASTFDRPADEHTQVAELTIERAKRLVEDGEDVCIILDGITRLARAYNLSAPATGRIMSGGVDSGALYPPKKFFGAARNIEEGGSLTILATALIETGSKMDEVIFEEFKGTGNMELRLDRRLAERRIYPAIDVDASSTRHEELLFERKQLDAVWALRRVLSAMSGEGGGNAASLDLLMDRMKTFRTNEEFLSEVAKNRIHG